MGHVAIAVIGEFLRITLAVCHGGHTVERVVFNLLGTVIVRAFHDTVRPIIYDGQVVPVFTCAGIPAGSLIISKCKCTLVLYSLADHAAVVIVCVGQIHFTVEVRDLVQAAIAIVVIEQAISVRVGDGCQIITVISQGDSPAITIRRLEDAQEEQARQLRREYRETDRAQQEQIGQRRAEEEYLPAAALFEIFHFKKGAKHCFSEISLKTGVRIYFTFLNKINYLSFQRKNSEPENPLKRRYHGPKGP